MFLFGCLFHDSVYFLDKGKESLQAEAAVWRALVAPIYVMTHIFALCPEWPFGGAIGPHIPYLWHFGAVLSPFGAP